MHHFQGSCREATLLYYLFAFKNYFYYYFIFIIIITISLTQTSQTHAWYSVQLEKFHQNIDLF